MACIDDWDNLNAGEQMSCLKKTVASLKSDIKGMTSEASKFSDALGGSSDIFTDMTTTIGSMAKRMVSFTKDWKQQYQLSEQIAQSYKKTSLAIGLSVGRTKDLSKEFKSATAEVAKYGGTWDDVESIYSDFANSSGRARILNEEEVSNVFKLAKASQLYGSEAASLYETLELMGVSNEGATKRMNTLVGDSQKIGLNSAKVMKVLSNNMKSMQSYSFASGVKGMTEMAKLGVKLRMEVSDMLGMADKFYEPEAAIEAVANLQMLGGDVADAFGDPFEIMYLARNKPEELAKKMQDMTENMMTFNKETKQYEFPAEARMQLKAAGEQLGINTDNMIEMARQTSKMKDVKDKLSMSSTFNEDEMDAVASLSRLNEEGEFVVDIRNGDDKVTKSIDKLTSGDLEMLIKPPDSEGDYQSDMLYNAQTTNEHLAAMEDSGKKTFISDVVDVYQITEDVTKEGIVATQKLFDDMGSVFLDQGQDMLSKLVGNTEGFSMDEWAEKTGTKIAAGIDKINIFKNGGIDMTQDVSSILDLLNEMAGTEGEDGSATESQGGDGSVTEGEVNKDFMVRGNGNVTSFTSKDDVIGAMKGGPLDKLLSNNISSGNNTPVKIEPITITLNGDLSLNTSKGSEKIDVDSEALRSQVTEMINNALNGTSFNGGKPGQSLNTSR